MNYSKKNIDQYLAMYPHYQKWINRCPLCGARGYNPDMPDIIGSPEEHGAVAAQNIRRMFKPLDVDSDGYCSVCSKLLKQSIGGNPCSKQRNQKSRSISTRGNR